MIEVVPGYVSITFIITTFLTVGFLFYAIKESAFEAIGAKLAVTLIAFGVLFHSVLAIGGFYQNTAVFPPRLALFALTPSVILIVILFLFFRKTFIEKLPLKTLTLLHVIRVPVEIVLWWLFQNGQIPRLMTFEGRNFDILAGLTAPFVVWIAFRNGKPKRALLLGWNVVSLMLLANIVSLAIMSLPSPFQQMAFEQPNRAVLYFPYIWLPAIVVPIVLFAHLTSLWNIFKNHNL